MTTILCFGDSNTWGAVPEEDRRYSVTERWPALLRGALPMNYELIEEGQPGRTTVHDDPFELERNGLRYLRPCLESHVPDLVLIMLGTNDLKHRFGLSPYDITQGVSRLVEETLKFECSTKKKSPSVLLISPPPIHEVGFFADMFAGGAAKSQYLAEYYESCANDLGCSFIDAGSIVRSCEKEGIHWGIEQHKLLANALLKKIQELSISS
jgi:lysophospholipase L1-like esterase